MVDRSFGAAFTTGKRPCSVASFEGLPEFGLHNETNNNERNVWHGQMRESPADRYGKSRILALGPSPDIHGHGMNSIHQAWLGRFQTI